MAELWGEMASSFSGDGKMKKLKAIPVQDYKGDEIFDDW